MTISEGLFATAVLFLVLSALIGGSAPFGYGGDGHRQIARWLLIPSFILAFVGIWLEVFSA